MAWNAKHIPDNEHWKHVSVERSTEEGACLFHAEETCPPTDASGNSCQYRWQGTKETDARKLNAYRNYPVASERAAVAGRSLPNPWMKQGGQAAKAYGEKLAIPKQRGDWDLGGPARPIRKRRAGFDATQDNESAIVKGQYVWPGQNFKNSYVPYWNNAHHLITKSMFAKAMMEIKPDDIRDLVVAGLFRAPYNINHMKNIMFLPMDREVAMLLHLPRHLTRDEGSEVEDRIPFFNHHRYNMLVKEGMTEAIDIYKAAAQTAMDNQTDECTAIESIKLSRRHLETLSGDCVTEIVGFGAAKPGAPLVDMDLGY